MLKRVYYRNNPKKSEIYYVILKIRFDNENEVLKKSIVYLVHFLVSFIIRVTANHYII